MVREHEVGREVPGRAAALASTKRSRSARVTRSSGLEPLVAVEHERRQEAVRAPAARPRAAQVEPLRLPLLADDHDVVPGSRPFPGDRRV